MLLIEDVLDQLGHQPDRDTLQNYITRTWIAPIETPDAMYFEEIDITRIRLVHQLQYEMDINDEAMDIILSLIDQMYGMQEALRLMQDAVLQQPDDVQNNIRKVLLNIQEQTDKDE